jgi:hypothetical protein
MKQFSLILVVLSLLLGTSISVAAVNEEKDKITTSEEIGTLLKNPSFLVDEEATINVTFVVNKKNEIVILLVDTKDQLLESFIKSRLNYEKLQNSLSVGKEYKVSIRILSEK